MLPNEVYLQMLKLMFTNFNSLATLSVLLTVSYAILNCLNVERDSHEVDLFI